MATNIRRYLQEWPGMSLVCSHPSAPVTNQPVRIGKMTGIALTDEGEGGNAATETTVYLGDCVVEVTVDDNEGSGIAVGDIIYYHDTGTGTGSVNLNNSSIGADAVFGVALEAVSANATTAIDVRHMAVLP